MDKYRSRHVATDESKQSSLADVIIIIIVVQLIFLPSSSSADYCSIATVLQFISLVNGAHHLYGYAVIMCVRRHICTTFLVYALRSDLRLQHLGRKTDKNTPKPHTTRLTKHSLASATVNSRNRQATRRSAFEKNAIVIIILNVRLLEICQNSCVRHNHNASTEKYVVFVPARFQFRDGYTAYAFPFI